MNNYPIFSIMFLLFVLTLLLFLVKKVREPIIFLQYNKDAMKEYEYALDLVKKGEGSSLINNLNYTDLKYQGFKVENNKRIIMYKVIHPYELYLRDKKTSNISLKNWEKNVFLMKQNERDIPAIGVSDYLSKREPYIDFSEKFNIPYNPWIFFS